MEQRYMNGVTAAHYLGISTTTLRRWRDDYGLPFQCIATMIRYDRLALDKFMSKDRLVSVHKMPY